jgi:hypothetical protein
VKYEGLLQGNGELQPRILLMLRNPSRGGQGKACTNSPTPFALFTLQLESVLGDRNSSWELSLWA